MRKPRSCCCVLSVVVVVLFTSGLSACGPSDPLANCDRCGPLSIPTAGYSAAVGGAGSVAPPYAGFVSPAPAAGRAAAAAGTWVVAAGQSGSGSGSGSGPAPAGGAGTGMVIVAGTGGGTPMELAPFDAGSAMNRNMVQPGALCARVAVIQCAGEAHCCVQRNRTVEACQATMTMLCSQMLYLDQIAANPVAGFDAAATAAAFGELEQKAAQCDISIAAWAGSPQGLRGILKGTLAPGASCKPLGNLTDPPTAGAALASCTGIATTACLPKSVLGDWTCAPKNSAGGSCATDNNCASGYYCHNPNMAPLGKCAALAALGGACTAGSECMTLFCKAGQCIPADQQVAYCPQP